MVRYTELEYPNLTHPSLFSLLVTPVCTDLIIIEFETHFHEICCMLRHWTVLKIQIFFLLHLLIT
jgi:hypothetical protein